MSEIDKINSWMTANGLTVSQLAVEMHIPYINAYMCIEKRKRLSSTFEAAFRRRFGNEVANTIFDMPGRPERVMA